MTVRCCVVGGGPAGMMLGLLLARAGIEVVVLEKHADFLRDFRGDTIHPSTLELMHELGLLGEFLKRPHEEASQLKALIGDTEMALGDLSHLPTRCRFIAFMPQWEFLNFLADKAQQYPSFKLCMQAEVKELKEESGRVTGVLAMTPDGPLHIKAELVVGADGRQSTVRQQAGLQVTELGAPMDVLWMRLSRRADELDAPLLHFDSGAVFVMINRGTYWQCGLIIAKGSYQEIRTSGLDALRQNIARMAPVLSDRLSELRDFDDVKLLTVCVDRLNTWYRSGLLCIGDAAHAMSPVGGVGINLAIQDAVAAANLLYTPLRYATVTAEDLQKVQSRRELPAKLTQKFQVLVQNRLIRLALSGKKMAPPWPIHLIRRSVTLRRLLAHLIGVGIRAEHVQTPEFHAVKK
jgi:2-polyprenyl-6-methoxyphenol hydroxylase-like FAD-dependent oxidoreductase